MYEFEIINKTTNEKTFIFGCSYTNAIKRNPHINPNDWECVRAEYVD